MPADHCNTWLYLEKHPNQIKSRNRCCLELNTFQRLISKDIIALFILHVSRPAQPLPLPQTTYEGWCGGWLWNGLTSLACFTFEMKLLIFRLPSLSPSLNLFSHIFLPFPIVYLLCWCSAFANSLSTTVIKQHEGVKYTGMGLKGANFFGRNKWEGS